MKNLNSVILKQNLPVNINKKKIRPEIVADWVQNDNDLKKVQQLRYKIFKKELGANIKGLLDRDKFDDYCEHLIIKDSISNIPVGTYRVLTPFKAKEYGSLYTESEFDIGPLFVLKSKMIELGRACIDKRYRTGSVIMMLWAEIAKFMITNDYRYLIGCSSVSVKDGGHNAANIYQSLKDQKKIHEINGVRPFNPLPVDKLFNDHLVNIPPLLNGYLKLGARIIGKPAWDPEFQTADFLTLLDLDDLPDRYKNHFLKG
ncbi:MAG: GNAT family N-acetyltransferase [Proteobacteria bacterium]|nr:GNAT family N-acetyltransferase [Pseudomonadota bacterium]MDA0941265.1 GNAT family N-acetyltransferase [Pseudomonadota bacterium]MDA1034065.1 GNAT family N-acetyltransferase [Pseudomonadota bacterium]